MLKPPTFKILTVWGCLFSIGLRCAGAEQTNAWPNEIQDLADSRRMFIEIYRISRLQAAAQSGEVEHVYSNLFIPFYQSFIDIMVDSSLPTNHADLSLEQVADALTIRGNFAVLTQAGKGLCLQILKSYGKDVATLASADLRSSDVNRNRRGLCAIITFRLSACFTDTLDFFQKDEKLVDWSSTALGDLADPRAIRPLIERYPDRPMQFFECLRILYRGQKPDSLILKLLESQSSDTRWRAIYALGECGSDELVPIAAKLMKDQSPGVREYAGLSAFNLSESAYAKLRADVIFLLDDPSEQVRWHIGICVASRKHDPVCGKALLRLLSESGPGNDLLPSTIDCIQRMTGSPLDYHPDKPPTDPANKAALERFAKWVEQHK